MRECGGGGKREGGVSDCVSGTELGVNTESQPDGTHVRRRIRIRKKFLLLIFATMQNEVLNIWLTLWRRKRLKSFEQGRKINYYSFNYYKFRVERFC